MRHVTAVSRSVPRNAYVDQGFLLNNVERILTGIMVLFRYFMPDKVPA